jgi:hypothetical protein
MAAEKFYLNWIGCQNAYLEHLPGAIGIEMLKGVPREQGSLLHVCCPVIFKRSR